MKNVILFFIILAFTSITCGQIWDTGTMTWRNGKVGIGTLNPNAKLDVNGNAIIGDNASSSFLHVGDNYNSTLNAQALGPQPIASHSVGLHADGTVYSWGYNNDGQLGDNTRTQRNTPIKVNGVGGTL